MSAAGFLGYDNSLYTSRDLRQHILVGMVSIGITDKICSRDCNLGILAEVFPLFLSPRHFVERRGIGEEAHSGPRHSKETKSWFGGTVVVCNETSGARGIRGVERAVEAQSALSTISQLLAWHEARPKRERHPGADRGAASESSWANCLFR
jgi:hypothetical protein